MDGGRLQKVKPDCFSGETKTIIEVIEKQQDTLKNESEQKKIVRIIARLNTGGPARHVVWLSKGLEEYKTSLVCGTVPNGEGNMEYFAQENGVKPIFIEEMSRELSPKDVISLWKVLRLLQREKPEIIHTHTAKAGTIGRIAGFLYRWLTLQILLGKPHPVKFVHTYHGHVFHSYYGKWKTLFFLTIERTLARFATDKIIVLSEQQRREIHEDFKVGQSKQFSIVPLGIDLEPFQQWRDNRHILRDEISAKSDEILVGLVGRLTEVKNHSMFLQVAKIWLEQKTSDFPPIRFVIIGDGHLREKLEAEARDLGVTEIVRFLGERSDPQVFYPALDIVALTSLNEGTPLSLIEAMANSRANISTAVGGVVDLMGETVQNADDLSFCERGVLVPSEKPEVFFKGLLFLAQNPIEREKFGKKGEIFVRERYGKERLLRDIRELYLNLI